MRSAQRLAVQYEPRSSYSEQVYIAPLSHVVAFPKQKRALRPLQKWSCVLLSSAILFAGVQAVRCAVDSGFKLEGLLKQQAIVSHVNHDAQVQHAYLQDKIALYSSPSGIEEMARDRLGLVGENEVLVRVYPTSLAQR